MRTLRNFGAILLPLLICLRCVSTDHDRDTYAGIAVKWELVTNFTDTPDEFEARFVLMNNGKNALDDKGWRLFFSMAPRPLKDNKSDQPARIEHINGDWYKLSPEPGFRLAPGDSVEVRYWGTEGVIKDSDRPMGLYFVFYDEQGNEENIARVTDYTFIPFTRPEQINRSAEDEEPIPTAQHLFQEYQSLSLLEPAQLKKVIPTPVKTVTADGQFVLSGELTIIAAPALDNEAQYLAESLRAVTKARVNVSHDATQSAGILLTTADLQIAGKREEAYHLKVTPEQIVITGSDAAGVFYGIQSLRALLPVEAWRGAFGSVAIPAVTIEDAPRFGYRGLHVDVARNFQSAETIKRILDVMSFYKLNRFLFYTTEDEGWRVEIPGLPELTSVGAMRRHAAGMEEAAVHPAYGSGPFPEGGDNHGSGYYTREEFIDILKYAKARHIKVIPELNFPGHARAAIKSMEARYERLMAEGKEDEANEYRLIDPEDRSVYLSAQSFKDNVVSVARESTYRFYEKVVDELAEMYREAGLIMDEIHAGGDEVAEGAWTQSPMASALMKEHPEMGDPKNLQAYFFRELLKRLKKRNLRVNGWEEVALLKNPAGGYDPNPEFVGQNVVPYIWNNLFDYPDLGYRLANAGYPVVLCNVSNFYFDLAYSKDPREPGLYWAGFVHTRDAWLFAPFDMFRTTLVTSMGRRLDPERSFAKLERLKPQARKNILGIQAQLWSETIKGRDMIEYYMLPKLIGFAESAWAAERIWETITDAQRREESVVRDWNIFANSIGQRELPRLAHLNGGYNYRVPPPGGEVRGGVLYANTAFPGLTVRYTTDGSEPDSTSPLYSGPVKVSGPVYLKAFDEAGRSSLVMRAWNNGSTQIEVF